MTTTGFSVLARLTGKAGGVPDLRIAEYPGPLGIHDAAQIEQNIGQALIEQIVDGSRAPTPVLRAFPASCPKAIVFSVHHREVSRPFHREDMERWATDLPPTITRVELP